MCASSVCLSALNSSISPPAAQPLSRCPRSRRDLGPVFPRTRPQRNRRRRRRRHSRPMKLRPLADGGRQRRHRPAALVKGERARARVVRWGNEDRTSSRRMGPVNKPCQRSQPASQPAWYLPAQVHHCQRAFRAPTEPAPGLFCEAGSWGNEELAGLELE